MTLFSVSSTAVLGLALALGLGLAPLLPPADASEAVIPRYEVDPVLAQALARQVGDRRDRRDLRRSARSRLHRDAPQPHGAGRRWSRRPRPR